MSISSSSSASSHSSSMSGTSSRPSTLYSVGYSWGKGQLDIRQLYMKKKPEQTDSWEVVLRKVDNFRRTNG